MYIYTYIYIYTYVYIHIYIYIYIYIPYWLCSMPWARPGPRPKAALAWHPFPGLLKAPACAHAKNKTKICVKSYITIHII